MITTENNNFGLEIDPLAILAQILNTREKRIFHVLAEKVSKCININVKMLRMKYCQEGPVDWYLKMWSSSTPRIVRALQVWFKRL